MIFRAGVGIDSHKFEEKQGKPLVLGGVIVKGRIGLKSHSDGDVISHAIFNALTGAIGERDLGSFFPDSDPQYSGADSMMFLKKALELVRGKGFEIGNIDVMVEAKIPKISLLVPAIKSRLAQVLETSEASISIKATSGEELTAFGRGEGIQATAIALVLKK